MLGQNDKQHPRSCEVERLRQVVEKLEASLAKQRETEKGLRDEQALLEKVLDLKEQDRQLAAYDLHDGVAQMLAGAMLHLQSYLDTRDRSVCDKESDLQAAMLLLEQASTEVRSFISGVGPECVVTSGLVVAVRSFLFETEMRAELDIEFLSDTWLGGFDSRLETALFRIVQESVNNAVRHSQSAKVRVALIQHDGHLNVSVTDWGIGFDVENVARDRLGLRGIRERTKLFGGQFRLETLLGRGTVVSVHIPVRSI